MTVDREASSVTLHYLYHLDMTKKGRATAHVRKVVKILQPKGVSDAVLFEHVSPSREMKGLEGWLIPAVGEVKDLEDQNVVEVSGSGSGGYYYEHRLLSAAFPNARVGDIAAYEYEIREEGFQTSFQSFQIQNEQPAWFVQFQVVVPEGWELRRSEWGTEEVSFERVANRYTWTGRDLPCKLREPFSPPRSYRIRTLSVYAYDPNQEKEGLFRNWTSVAQWSGGMLDAAALPDGTVSAAAQRVAAPFSSVEEKIQAVANFVAHDIRYVAVEIDKGRWNPRTASVTLNNRYGDCKDKSTLMRSMLGELNVSSAAVLVNASKYVDPDFPVAFQFDHCIVAIPATTFSQASFRTDAIAEGWFFYDPTDQNVPFGSLPSGLRGNNAFVLGGESAKLVRLPEQVPEHSRRSYSATLHVSKDASLKGKITVVDFGDEAASTRSQLRSTTLEKQLDGWMAFFKRNVKNAELSNLQIVDAGDSIVTTMDMASRGIFPASSNSNPLKLNIFAVTDPSTFKRPRHQSIWFGAPRLYTTETRWVFSADWIIDRSISKLDTTCCFGDIRYSITTKDSTIAFSASTRYTGTLQPPDSVSVAEQFLTNLNMARNVSAFLRRR